MFQTWLLKLRVYLLRKPRFRKWALLEDKKFDVIKAVEQSSPDFPLLSYEYISTALIFPIKRLNKIYWKDVVKAFLRIHGVTALDTSLPIIFKSPKQTHERLSWDYPGRLWYFYTHIIASAYGWTEKQIAYLSVRDGLAYIQEILTAEHFEHEFLHGLSETSYSYDKHTKKSKYIPLSTPYWMRKDKKELPNNVLIRKDMLPIGVIEKIHAPKET